MFDTEIMVNYTKLSDITAFRRMSFIHNRIIDIDCPGPCNFLWRWIVWIANPSRFEDINFVSEVAAIFSLHFFLYKSRLGPYGSDRTAQRNLYAAKTE